MNYNDAMTGDNAINIYDEAAQTAERAFRAFRALYEVQNPMPQELPYPAMPNAANKPKEAKLLGYKQWGMGLGLVGSVILSASHTIPVFLNKASALDVSLLSFEGVVAISIFVMIEVGLITFAYSKIEGSPNSETAKQVQELTGWGLKFILAIAILANVYYVLSGNMTIPTSGLFADVWYWTRVMIFLLIGTSAPLIALITGDILAMDVLKHRATIRRDFQAWEDKINADMQAWESKCELIRQTNEGRFAQWNEGLKQSWTSNKSKWNGAVNIQVSKPEIKQLEMQNAVSDSLGQSDRSKTLNMKGALQYIELHQSELEIALQTVLDKNPNATQSERAMALAEVISGDARGYKTVIRAYKSLGKDI